MSAKPPSEHWLEPLASLDTLTNSFVVTIRSQPRIMGSAGGVWHGSVEHAQSRERIYFIDYDRLNGFIAARSETPLRPTWRTRLLCRWQKTTMHHFLQRLLGTFAVRLVTPVGE